MMKKILLLGLTIILSACSLPDSSQDEVAEKMATDYLRAITQGDFSRAFSHCDEEFFASSDEDQWKAYYAEVKSQLGEIKNIKLKRHLIDERLTGRFFMFQFSNKYEQGYAREMITLIMKDDADGQVKIFGHKIESSKLKQD